MAAICSHLFAEPAATAATALPTCAAAAAPAAGAAAVEPPTGPAAVSAGGAGDEALLDLLLGADGEDVLEDLDFLLADLGGGAPGCGPHAPSRAS